MGTDIVVVKHTLLLYYLQDDTLPQDELNRSRIKRDVRNLPVVEQSNGIPGSFIILSQIRTQGPILYLRFTSFIYSSTLYTVQQYNTEA